MSTAAEWIAALLLAVRVPEPHRSCILLHRERIAASAELAAAAHHVPVSLLLSVAYMESHLGCAPQSGGCWGAPISRTRRDVAGGPDHAASALRRGYEVCHSDIGAIARFRWGTCTVPAGARGYTPADVLHLAARVAARIGEI